MAIQEGQSCRVLSEQDIQKLVQFVSLLIEIDQRVKRKKKLIAKIAWILRQVAASR